MVGELASLFNDGGGNITFSASTPLFSSGLWSGTGTTRSMAGISGSVDFMLSVPSTWQRFDLIAELQVSNEVGAAIPEPGCAVGLMVLASCVVCRRRGVTG